MKPEKCIESSFTLASDVVAIHQPELNLICINNGAVQKWLDGTDNNIKYSIYFFMCACDLHVIANIYRKFSFKMFEHFFVVCAFDLLIKCYAFVLWNWEGKKMKWGPIQPFVHIIRSTFEKDLWCSLNEQSSSTQYCFIDVNAALEVEYNELGCFVETSRVRYSGSFSIVWRGRWT